MDSIRQPWWDYKEELVIKTTPEQDEKIRAFIQARRQNPGTYVLTGRNCGTFVQDALREAGIDPIGDVAGPGGLFRVDASTPRHGNGFHKGCGTDSAFDRL